MQSTSHSPQDLSSGASPSSHLNSRITPDQYDSSWSYPSHSQPSSAEQEPESAAVAQNMIPPSSSFYDPQSVSQHVEELQAQRYQQWLDSYSDQGHRAQAQQAHTHHVQGQPAYSGNRHQGLMHDHQFTFQYAPHNPTYSSQQFVANNGTAGGYYGELQQQAQYAPSQHQQRTYSNSSYAAAQVATSDELLNPSPHLSQASHSSQSRSPLSWTEEALYSSAHASNSNATSSAASSSTAVQRQPSSSLPHTHSQVSTSPTVSTSSNSANPAPAKRSQQSKPTNSSPVSTKTGNANAPGSAGKRKRGAANKKSPGDEPPSMTAGLKRTRHNDDMGSDSDSEDDLDEYGYGGISVGTAGVAGGSGSTRKGRVLRLPGACTHCKKLKMKCDFPENDNTCKRCKSGGHVCIVEGRKPRTAPNKREYLLAQIRQKDAIIESLLKQLHNPYIATPLSIASYRMATSPSDSNNRNILAWLDRLQASVQNAGGKSGPVAFKLDSRMNGAGDDDDSDQEGDHLTHAQRYGLVPIDGDTVEKGMNGRKANGRREGDGSSDDDADKLQSSLPDSHVPLGLIANLSLSNNSKVRSAKKEGRDDLLDEENLDDDNVGVANETYFMPGPATDLNIRATLIEQHSPPEILVHGLVTPDDVDKLFEIFYERVNPFIHLLDPALHTPASTFTRSPFLYTVICAISSRYYPEKSEIYPIAMHFAKHSAANALIDGWKSVELCQAYILMSIYAVPARRWEEDRSWLYTGLAIRIATDLNLHQVPATKPQTEKQEREMLNRTRVWMICFNLDRSTATQFGKPSTVKEDFIMRNSQDWYKKSPYNLPYDVHLCGYTALLKIVAGFHDEIFSDPSAPSGLNKRLDFRTVTLKFDARLTAYQEEWQKRFSDALQPGDRGSAFRCLLLPFLVEYSRLIMFSFGFQQAYQRGIRSADDLFFTKCLGAAKSVIRNMVEQLVPSGYMRYSADGHFIFAAFASAFLLKVLRPEFSTILSKEEENEIFELIGRLIQTLSSPSIAIDDRHTPKLYARFLAGLLSRHRRDGATVGRLQPQTTQHLAPTTSDFTHGTNPSITTFPVTQPHNSHLAHEQSSNGYGQDTFSNGTIDKMSTPVYRPEVTYAAGAGPIQYADVHMVGVDGNMVAEDEMLATMRALKNPAWWQNMMMPGFTWPDASSPASNSPTPPASYNTQQSSPPPPPMNSGYGIFHAQPVALY